MAALPRPSCDPKAGNKCTADFKYGEVVSVERSRRTLPPHVCTESTTWWRTFHHARDRRRWNSTSTTYGTLNTDDLTLLAPASLGMLPYFVLYNRPVP